MWLGKKVLCTASMLVALCATGAPANAQMATIVPFGACGWTYYGNGMPPAPTQGCAPFAAPWADSMGCPATVGTAAPIASYWISRHVVSLAATDVPVVVRCYGTGNCTVYLNGAIGNAEFGASTCGLLVQSGGVLHPGDNVVAVVTSAVFAVGGDPSWHLGGYMDIEVLADQTTPIRNRSWGALKAIYR